MKEKGRLSVKMYVIDQTAQYDRPLQQHTWHSVITRHDHDVAKCPVDVGRKILRSSSYITGYSTKTDGTIQAYYFILQNVILFNF